MIQLHTLQQMHKRVSRYLFYDGKGFRVHTIEAIPHDHPERTVRGYAPEDDHCGLMGPSGEVITELTHIVKGQYHPRWGCVFVIDSLGNAHLGRD